MRKDKEQLRNRCYEAYKLDWMLSHGFTLGDLKEIFTGLAAEEVEEDPLSVPTDEASVTDLAERLENRFLNGDGFGSGMVYACREEFLQTEYLDRKYMERLFSRMPRPEEMMKLWEEDTGLGKAVVPETAKVLTLSTGHITERTAKLLDEGGRKELSDVCVYPKIGMPVGDIRQASEAEVNEVSYGWWVHIPKDDVSADLRELKDLPEDLFECIRYANRHGCEWLCLDRDGDEMDGIKTYEW